MIYSVDKMKQGNSVGVSFDITYTIPDEYDIIGNSAFVSVSGIVSCQDGFYEFAGTGNVTLQTFCALCLSPVEISAMEFPIVELFKEEKYESQNVLNEEDYFPVVDKKIDLGNAVYSNFLISIPSKTVCKQDCKGLCPVCGIDLNLQHCNCNENKTDDRFDVLKDFFQND